MANIKISNFESLLGVDLQTIDLIPIVDSDVNNDGNSTDKATKSITIGELKKGIGIDALEADVSAAVGIPDPLDVDFLNIGNEIRFGGAADNDSLIQQNASTNRDELQVYASGDAHSTNSKGAGIHLYGNGDDQHAGNIAFLTGQDDQGDGRMIISGGSRLTGSDGYRTNTDTRVTIGNDIWNYVDDGDDTALLTLKDPLGCPALYIEGAGTTEGDIAYTKGDKLSIGAWDGATFTQVVEIDTNENFTPASDGTVQCGSNTKRWSRSFTHEIITGTGDAIITSGSGSPEGVVTAVVGSMYTDTSGGAGTTLYVKESGTGNTGWAAK
jgi:hypothetical protein